MELTEKTCTAIKAGTPALSLNDEAELISQVQSWTLQRTGTHSISKQFSFPGFTEAIGFVNRVADIADAENHHPDIHIYYNRVDIELSTHAVNGLSENDFILAAKIDSLD